MQEITVGIGGAAGDGLDKTGDTLAKTCSRVGLHLFAYNSYQSVIRGGHIWLRVRIAEEKTLNHGDHLNAVIALNQDTIDRHASDIEEGGVLIFNADKLHVDEDQLREGVRAVPLSITDLMKPFGRQPAIMQNTVTVGALLYLLQIDFDTAAEVLEDTFRHKGQAIVETNIGLAKAGYDHTRINQPPIVDGWNFSEKRRAFLTGNETIALGALAAGCKFYAAYPMTPASSILHFLAYYGPKHGVVVKQAEDELAVVNMAIGAGHAGVRAMCATSGGGFALMTEAIGLAGMTETPVVIVEVQRGGPSTGLPTKTEQGDLNQVFGASQGEYPRMIVAPTDVVDCFYTTVEAFNIADKYQCPVTIVSDLYLSEHPETVDPDDLNFDVPIERGEIVSPEVFKENGAYKRYVDTPSGVSPRAFPGQEGTVFVAASDEHDERGVLISDVYTDPPTRREMMEKRMRKMDGILREIPPPQLWGPPDADVTLIGWGSTEGVIREAALRLNDEGISTNHLQITYLVPFHADEIGAILGAARRTVVVEQNYTAQLARHIRAETGYAVQEKILKYDGEPMEPNYVVEGVLSVLHGVNV
ncbi:MAG: 2-oxoacid:acceptor oxidoreductase subunit alpha [Candidatus Latescibacteria bacterium]|nr:2-oxoacid:acceptor oxidoreductase subunit alpha [Candidatus Latescibacterota bacterium]